jgi:hypothetical protein
VLYDRYSAGLLSHQARLFGQRVETAVQMHSHASARSFPIVLMPSQSTAALDVKKEPSYVYRTAFS